METILAIIFIVFGILQIILFFKIWGMTNDVREIKERLLRGEMSDQAYSEYKREEANRKVKSNPWSF